MINLIDNGKGAFCKCAPGEVGTHVFLEGNDYKTMVGNIENDRIFLRGWNMTAESAREDAEVVEKEIDDLDAEIEDMQKKLAKQDETADWFRATFADYDQDIANLLRIARERSNAARNLRPKKGHHGYRLVHIGQEKVSAGRSSDGSGNNIVGWKTTLETPYPATVHVEDIIDVIKKELVGNVFCGNIDILYCSPNEVPEEAFSDNTVYRIEFQANYKDQDPLWTITLHSVHELDLSELLK